LPLLMLLQMLGVMAGPLKLLLSFADFRDSRLIFAIFRPESFYLP
jgi:hypothetical protein